MAEPKGFQTSINKTAHDVGNGEAARRVSMRKGNGAWIVDVRRNGRRSNSRGGLRKSGNGRNEGNGGNAPLNSNGHSRL